MLSQIFFSVLCLASIPLWIIILANWFSRRKPPLEPRLRIQSPFGLLDVGIMFACWLASQFLAVGLVAAVTVVSNGDLTKLADEQGLFLMAIVACSQLIWTLIALWVIGLRYGHSPRIFGWQPEHFRADTRIGVFAYILIAPLIMIIQIVLTQFVDYSHSTLTMLEENPTLVAISVAWFLAVFVAPITEEIFFRGILQAWLQRQDHQFLQFGKAQILGGWNNSSSQPTTSPAYQPKQVYSDQSDQSRLRWMPILISSFVFAGVHLGQGLAPIPLFVFGLALGYVYRQTGSILGCIVIHMLLNGMSMFLFTVEIMS